MPTYEIEQYELFVQRYRVQAEDEAEAIAKLFNGDGQPIDNSTEYIEVADAFGMPADENRDLADGLRERGIAVGDDIIPSIRSIKQVE